MAQPASEPRFRFAFDIGGTFTDLVLAGSDGAIHTDKCLTRPDDLTAPIAEGLKRMLADHGVAPRQINQVVAGATTVVTNLIIERKGARTALITTQGFRDVLEIGRELRYDVYDLFAAFPEPLVPRHLRHELPERIDSRGVVITPLRDDDVERVIADLRGHRVEAIAVCLLHAFKSPAHEQRIKAIAHRIAPDLPVSLSSEVLAEIREYERTVATVLNAYVMPLIGGYLGQIEQSLTSLGINATLRIMQSNGGIISREFAERMPIRMLESGPAAGALAAAHLARSARSRNLLSFDMGGTTAKACLISDGVPEVTTEFETARVHRFKRGSGMPVRLPIVDLIEIGAGGGSIAHIDATGLLKVGPRSAGAAPGPALYGLGGVEPTVTDAALVLGYLDPEGSLSGRVTLRPDLAERAIATIAEPLGLDVVEAASGIYRVVCEHMAAAAKIHAVERGRDLRSYALVAFGGAGAMHAREVALRTGCRDIVIPVDAGVFSAIGLLVAPIKVDLVRTQYGKLANLDWRAIEALFQDMRRELAAALLAADAVAERIEYRRSADMRYVGQGFEVTAGLPPVLDDDRHDEIAECFHRAYERQYGHRLAGHSIEALNWRLDGVAALESTDLRHKRNGERQRGPSRRRHAYFPEIAGFVETPVVAHGDVGGNWRPGPALIEQPGSTVVVGPRDEFRADGDGALRIAVGGGRDDETVKSHHAADQSD